MSQDPYHAVQREIQNSLQTASTLRASYLRIRSTARDESEELVWARNEVHIDNSFLKPGIYPYVLLAQGDCRRHGGRLGGLRRECKVSPISPVGTQHELTRLRIVEEAGPRMFGLEESDVMERRGYVNYVKQEIEVRQVEYFMRSRLTIHRKDRPFDPN